MLERNLVCLQLHRISIQAKCTSLTPIIKKAFIFSISLKQTVYLESHLIFVRIFRFSVKMYSFQSSQRIIITPCSLEYVTFMIGLDSHSIDLPSQRYNLFQSQNNRGYMSTTLHFLNQRGSNVGETERFPFIDGVIIILPSYNFIMPTIELFRIQQLAQGFDQVKIHNKEIRRYFVDLISAFWVTLYKGYLFDSEAILKELNLILNNEKESVAHTILVELNLLECELWIKKKKSDELTKCRDQLLKNIQTLGELQLSQLVFRYNALLLYDQKVQPIWSEENNLVDIIKMSDEGHIDKAISLLQPLFQTCKQLKQIKTLLLGKIYLLQPNVLALECFSQVARSQLLYQSHLAKILLVAGYKALQKLNKNPQEYAEQYRKCEQYIQNINHEDLSNKLQQLEIIFKQIRSSQTPEDQLENINNALEIVSKLSCYPSSSILQLDLHLASISAKTNQGKYNQAKKIIQMCKAIAQKIGIYSGSKQSKINYKLALISEREKKLEEALVLVERCISQQFKDKQLQVLYDMRNRLQNKNKSLNNSLIHQQQEEGQSAPDQNEQIVGSKNVLHQRNKQNSPQSQASKTYQQERENNVQKQESSKKKTDSKKPKCCLLF